MNLNLTSGEIMNDIFLVDGCRTPFLKAKGKPGAFSAAELAVQAGQQLLLRQSFNPTDLDGVIFGSVMPSEKECNIGRVISLRLNCGDAVPAYTVQRNCGSGMQSIDSAMKDIREGRGDLILAGGVESMSQAPLKFNNRMVNWLADWMSAKTFGAKASLLTKLRPGFFAPIITLIHGLTDPVVNIGMGQTAENLAYRFNITREEMDTFALHSHQRAAHAQKEGYFADEIVPVYDRNGKVYEIDTGVRPENSMEQLGKLKPVFDKKFGQITAGNSSQITDGAAVVILASQKAVDKYQLPVLGKIVDVQWAALEPEEMGLGPAFAVAQLLHRQQLSMSDIDYWEINEAFAAQVLAVVKAWENNDYSTKRLGLNAPLGDLDLKRLNVDGGAVALGHPVGASGTRIVLHLFNVLKRHNAKRGVAGICIGGGQGGAMLLERIGN